MSAFRTALDEALAGLPRPVSADARARMEQHWHLVSTWNARVNLTAISDETQAAWRHYRDSLQALPLLPPGPLVDMGSGAGFPGVPLAIVEPERAVTLVEPRRKRVSFLQVAVARLGLANIRVLEGSHTDPPDANYAAVVTRATFSAEKEILECMEWARPGGLVIAYRSDPTGIPGSALYPYQILHFSRVLEVWTKPTAAEAD